MTSVARQIVGSVALQLTIVAGAFGQTRPPVSDSLRAAYTVEVKPADRLFHVTATFSHLGARTLDVALPVWTPGVYNAKGYAVNVRQFTAHDSAGRRLRAPKIQPSAWRVETDGQATVSVEFDYVATDLSWNGAGITPAYAVFTGTQLFLEPVGHRHAPATVKFIVPAGWTIVSALRETADSSVFVASNYDDLVDAPTLMGSVEVTRFDVGGTPHILARAPASPPLTNVAEKVSVLRRIIETERAIFGSLPYDKYVFFGVANLVGGAVEHANSYLTDGGYDGWPDPGGVAHEMFHLWNVKRIRPAEMWPYDYSRVNPGPSLWVAEGVTSYYQFLVAYRAGLRNFAGVGIDGTASTTGAPAATDPETQLLLQLARRIGELEANPERRFVSPTDASMSDGLGYGSVAPNYYTTGEILGALLDLSILHDTRGQRRLDDVMRTLYSRFYLQGRGYTTKDLVTVVSEVAGRDYAPFFEHYVVGTDDFPIDSVFSYAGYSLTRSTRAIGVIPGITGARVTPEGFSVYLTGGPQTAAVRAGIARGDVITAVDGVAIHEVLLANLFLPNWIGGRFVGRAGDRVVLTVMRDTTRREIPITLNRLEEQLVRIDHDAAATASQLAVRTAWLRKP